jgi:hypothetical protein
MSYSHVSNGFGLAKIFLKISNLVVKEIMEADFLTIQ